MASHYYERHNVPRQKNAAGVDFKDINKKLPALFLALNTPLFDIDKRNAAVRGLYEGIYQVVPLRWKFVAAVICPSGEILFSSMQPQGNISQGSFTQGTMSKYSKSVHNHVHIKTVFVFPHNFSPDGLVQTLPRVYTDVLGPLNDIIERSRRELSSMDNAAAEMYSSQEAKRQWWKDRQDIDFELS